MDRYDLMVIGGGPAGYLAAQRSAQKGKKVLLFEKKRLGGVCLNEGCIPTKTLLNSAKLYDHAKGGRAFGVTAKEVSVDIRAVLERKQKVIDQLVSGVGMTMRRNKITVISEHAQIKGEAEEGFLVEAGGETYEARNLLIASGSTAMIPPIKGVRKNIERGFVLTSRELLNLEELPGQLVVVGAGVVGLEMAAYFATLGTEVTVIEMLDKIAGNMDGKISRILQREMEKKGIRFMLGCQVTEFKQDGLLCQKGEETIACRADKILLAIGRKPVVEGFGLEHVGVEVENGRIVTDEHLRTSAKGIYAAGDINGKSMLAHTAYRESEVAVNDMSGLEDRMDYHTIPSVIYTNPELAAVGETQESAEKKGIPIKLAEIPMAYSGRFTAENEGVSGTCRLLMNQETGCLEGTHILGSYASEMIWGIAACMEQGMTVEEMKKIVFPHPSVSEIIREAIFKLCP